MTSKRAVFVDRDGTLNEMVYDENHGLFDSPRRPEQVRLKSGAASFIRSIKRAGFFVCVVTNQPGLAKGLLTLDELAAVNARLAELLFAQDAAWDDLRFCPHHPNGNVQEFARTCNCRKPAPGMLLEAAREHGLAPAQSWMVGDGLNDVQAGKAAGCGTILLTTLKIEQIERFLNMKNAEPDIVLPDFAAATNRILNASKDNAALLP